MALCSKIYRFNLQMFTIRKHKATADLRVARKCSYLSNFQDNLIKNTWVWKLPTYQLIDLKETNVKKDNRNI